MHHFRHHCHHLIDTNTESQVEVSHHTRSRSRLREFGLSIQSSRRSGQRDQFPPISAHANVCCTLAARLYGCTLCHIRSTGSKASQDQDCLRNTTASSRRILSIASTMVRESLRNLRRHFLPDPSCWGRYYHEHRYQHCKDGQEYTDRWSGVWTSHLCDLRGPDHTHEPQCEQSYESESTQDIGIVLKLAEDHATHARLICVYTRQNRQVSQRTTD